MDLDRSELEAVLKRAIAIDQRTDYESFDLGAVEHISDELGVSRTALMQAIEEVVVVRAIRVKTSAQLVVPAPQEEVLAAIESFFRLRGLKKTGVSIWEQGAGWWPDLYRIRTRTPVSVWTGGREQSTSVRVTARLGNVWRSHVAAGVVVPVVLLLWGLAGGSLSQTVPWLPVVAVWVVAVAWAYRLRRQSIARRMTAALHDIARPSYRLAPW
jgi:hypothetical protein